MQYLQKITITNARRFGKKIEIEIGQGATIILAPNGTGKTTVFEAIEFALTGKIQRLPHPPLSLIKDNEDGLDIRLDFEEEKYCEVVYKKDGEIELKGFHSELFGDHDPSEIPYLLRLTHLLEQRGTGWFVQQENEENAGGLLDKLSIGAELLKINNNKMSITKAATAAVTAAKDDETKAKEELANFMVLVNKRNASRVDFELEPLANLLVQLNEIHKATNAEPTKTEEEVNPLLGFAGQVEAVVINYLKTVSDRLTQFSKVENLIEVYAANEKTIAEKEQSLQAVKKTIELAKEQIELNKKNSDEFTNKRNEAKNKSAELTEIKNDITNREIEIANELELNKQNKEANKNLPSFKNRLVEVNVLLEAQQKLIDSYKLLQQRETEILKTKGHVITLESLVEEWTKQQNIITDTAASISSLQKDKQDQENVIHKAETDLETAEKQLQENSNMLSSLRNASDSILSAVGIIATNLPKDEGNCPVCTASYEPGELQDRMKKALSAISPLLITAIQKNQELQAEAENYKNKVAELKQLHQKLIGQITAQQDLSNQATGIINKTILPNFPSAQNVQTAIEWLRDQKTAYEKDLQMITEERKSLQPEPKEKDRGALKIEQSQLETEIQNKEKTIRDIDQKINANKAILYLLNKKIGAADTDNIKPALIVAEEQLKTLEEEIKKLTQLQDDAQKIADINNKIVVTENGLIAQLQGQQNEIKSKWEQAKLEGVPTTGELQRKREQLLAEEKNMLDLKTTLVKINENLARWKTAEQYEQHNKEVIQLTGTLSEEDFQRKLNEKVKSLTKEWKNIEEKKKVLTGLFANVAKELTAVHNYINAINPLWSSFLKRVVVNPRFANITLESSTFRNKTHAGVKIDLHKNKVKVTEVASEAQITDLQLTFMLSMAQTHKWTSWKGLLMDDPTQHHDLVHAAGVFDLLRDQIIDNKFQVLLGTHDSVQALFFQRKLQNDGVRAKIWNLIADDNGVKAECID